MDIKDPEFEKFKDVDATHAVSQGNKVTTVNGTIDDLDPLEDE